MKESLKHYTHSLDNSSLPIELGTELLLDISGLGYHLKSTLIGLEAGNFLLAKIPFAIPPNIVSSALVRNTRVVVRYFFKGMVFGFECQINQAITHPAPLLFLTYPKSIEEHNIREYKRIHCFLPSKISIGERSIEGTITDISKKGCSWHTKRTKLNDNDDLFDGLNKTLAVELQLPGIKELLKIQGVEKNVKKDDENIDVGIEFSDTDSQHMGQLAEFIDTAEQLS
jgi:hypothetical protein